MLQTLLISGTLALLAAAPGQAQVPIQADFDASQVRMDMPGLAASDRKSTRLNSSHNA